MKTVYCVLDKVNSIEIGQQYDHKATLVQFTNLNFQGSVYIRVEIGDYRNMIPLLDDSLIVGRPLTNQSGTVRAQLYSMTDDGDYEELSKVFNMIIKPSIGYSDPTDYPVEPNIEYIYEQLQQVTQACQTATSECETATEGLEDLKTAIEEATTAANNAASNANEKASACETATTAANSAASNANEKASACETVTASAQAIVTQWQGIGLDDIQADISALQTKIANILAGTTAVLVETEEEDA